MINKENEKKDQPEDKITLKMVENLLENVTSDDPIDAKGLDYWINEKEDSIPMTYDIPKNKGMSRNRPDPRKTFESIDFRKEEHYPAQDSYRLSVYSEKMAKGELTYKERMYFAMLVLQREIDGYVGQSFYDDSEEYLRNTVAEILQMDHNRLVKPIDVTPDLGYLTSDQKWEMFEKWEPVARVPKINTLMERPDR